MIVSGISGNEIFCLAQKGWKPHEIVVGNNVSSLGVLGGIGANLRGFTGGELENVTTLISEGRHLAIERMEQEAERHGAAGITGVVSSLGSLAGYVEFLAQGTAIVGKSYGDKPFSTAASGMELYCHVDAGYRPIRFAMGNVAYALGVGRGLTGGLRTLGRGEVHEYSQLYNHIRHLALERLRKEAFELGANAVVDVRVRILRFGPSVELLMTGTASHHEGFHAERPEQIVTSELTGEELWNLAAVGMVPVQLCMATSIVSLGVVGGFGAALRGLGRGEVQGLTTLIYEARENCIALLGEEAEKYGAEQVIGNRLSIREMSAGLVEVIALGTGVRHADDMRPETETLLPQAIIVETGGIELNLERSDIKAAPMATRNTRQAGPMARLIGLAIVFLFFAFMCGGGFLASLLGH